MIAVLDGYLINSSYETKVVFMESCCSAEFRGRVVLDGHSIGLCHKAKKRRHRA